MKIKCDTCNNQRVSDETSVGCGYVPYCIKGHWDTLCEQDYYEDNNIEYCTFRDNCKDYESNLTDFKVEEIDSSSKCSDDYISKLEKY